MNQSEQWFSILVRKRLRIADFASIDRLTERLQAFILECNERVVHHGTVSPLKRCQSVTTPSQSRLI